MKIVKTKKRDLLIVLALAMAFILGLGFFNFINTNAFNSSLSKVFAADFVPGDMPTENWANTNFQGENLFINLDANNGNITDTSLLGSGTEAEPYQISTAEELALLSFVSRRASYYSQFDGLYFRQTADISLVGKLWTPIGTSNSARRFAGNFDGGNFVISGMYAYTTSSEYWGLFSSIEGGEFKNIKIEDAYVNNMSRNYAGILSAYALNVKVSNVEISGLLTAQEDTKPDFIGRGSYIGGLFGFAENTSDIATNIITNVTNNAVVRGGTYVGGVIGYLRNVNVSALSNSASAKVYGDANNNNYTGGVIGLIDGVGDISVQQLLNYGYVQANYSTVGGLVGNSTNNYVRLVIEDSKNFGVVKALNESLNEHRNIAGGIIGRANYITLINVENHGEIFARNEIGGLMGRSDRETFIINSSNGDEIDKTEAKINAIAVNDSGGFHAGGLVGYISNITHIESCDNYGEVIGNINSYGYNGNGGLVGSWVGKDSSIINSNNHANITGNAVGGAIGYISGAKIDIIGFINYGTLTSSRIINASALRGVGGVIGLASNAGSTVTISNAINNSVAKLYGSFVGGIIGNANAMGIITLNSCENLSSIVLEEEVLEGTTINCKPNSVGGLIGYSNARLVVNNSYNKAEIKSSGNYVGGLVGRMLHSTSTLLNCHNEASVTGFSYVGGIIGEGRGTYTSVTTLFGTTIIGTGNYVGGIIGLSYGTTFINVLNNAEIKGGLVTGEIGSQVHNDGSYIGGLIGSSNSGSTVRIEDSMNNAKVFGRIAVGGLIGRSTQTTIILQSKNTAQIIGTYYYVGGLVGQQSAGNLQINDSENTNAIVSNTLYVTTIGNVSLSTGGIVGSVTGTNCFLFIEGVDNNGTVSGQFVGGIVGFINISVVSNSQLINVHNYAYILVDYNYSLIEGLNINNYGGYAGGLVGTGGTSTGAVSITNSTNSGNVAGRYVGGLVASMHTVDIFNSKTEASAKLTTFLDTEDNSYEKGLGGLVYRAVYFARIYNCESNATFEYINGRVLASAGLVALSRNIIIRNSTNNSSININNEYGSVRTTDYIGGLVAYANNFTTFEITDSFSNGNIFLSYGTMDTNSIVYIGGVIGRALPTIGANSNANGITFIKNVIVDANVDCDIHLGYTYIGGLAGELNYSFDISNIVVKSTSLSGKYMLGGLVGRIYLTYDVKSNLPYNFKNVMFEGNICSQTPLKSTPTTGTLIGYILFHDTSSVNYPHLEEIKINIINSYTDASIESDAGRTGGLIGWVQFSNRSTNTVNQYVNIENTYFVEYGSVARDAVSYISNPGENEYSKRLITSNALAVTVADIRDSSTFEDWTFGYGDDATFWAISPSYNTGKPYLSNLFDATITFQFHDGYTGQIIIKEFKSKVGNNLILSENLVAMPEREFYDFVGWSTTSLVNGVGETDYIYGNLLEVSSDNIIIYAVWQPERLLIDIVGLADLYDTTGNVVTNKRITADTDFYLEAIPGTDEFIEWQIYNYTTGSFESYETDLLDVKLELGGFLTPNFINQYSYDDNGTKTISFQAIIVGTNQPITIRFAESTGSDWASVKVDSENFADGVSGENYRVGRSIDVVTGENIYISFTPKVHYEFDGFTVINSAGEEITGVELEAIYLGEIIGGLPGHAFVASDRITIQLSFKKINYDISVKQVFNNINLDNADELVKTGENYLVNDQNFPLIVTIGDSYVSSENEVLTSDSIDIYGFVHFVIKNRAGNYIRYTPSKDALTANFLSNYANNENKIEILAVYVKRYQINFTINNVEGAGSGEVSIFKLADDGKRESIIAGTYINENTNIIIEAYADNNSKFENFVGLSTDANVLGATANFRITEDTDILVNFTLSYYILKGETIDNKNQKVIDYENNIDFLGVINLNKVTIGTIVYKVALVDEIDGYQFMGWYINLNGELIDLKEETNLLFDENNNINSFLIDQEFLNKYVNDNNEIIFVAKYFELYLITIESSDISKGGFNLYKISNIENEEIEELINYDGENIALIYGTFVKIVPTLSNDSYYAFTNYTGLNASDTLDMNALIFTITTNRYITLNFESVAIEYETKVDTSNAKGTLKFSADTFAVGDTITITFETDSGYEVREWTIIDKNGHSHKVSDLDNVKYSGTNTLTLNVDEYWLENFGTEFESKITTMMNSTFFMILLIGGIAGPILLAGVIIFIILNNKKKARARASAKHSAANKFGLNQQQFLKSLVDDDNSSNNKKSKQ